MNAALVLVQKYCIFNNLILFITSSLLVQREPLFNSSDYM